MRDRVAGARVRERHPHRALRRGVEAVAEALERGALLLVRQIAVGHVVDLARERVDRRDRLPLRLGQEHDPVSEVARAATRDPLDLGVGLGDGHVRRASSARRATFSVVPANRRFAGSCRSRTVLTRRGRSCASIPAQ